MSYIQDSDAFCCIWALKDINILLGQDVAIDDIWTPGLFRLFILYKNYLKISISPLYCPLKWNNIVEVSKMQKYGNNQMEQFFKDKNK